MNAITYEHNVSVGAQETETNLPGYCNHFRTWNVRIGHFEAPKQEKITLSLTKILLVLIEKVYL